MGEQKISLATDSLISQLLSERAKVEQLQKELKSNKATSRQAHRPAHPKRYPPCAMSSRTTSIQIDSLQSANDRLRQENSEVRASYARATNEAQQLSNEKAQLSDRVKLAAKLDATRISITPMDKRGKLSKKLEKTVNIQIHFTVAKNVTAAVGEKTFYCRITQPNEELLVKPGTGTFPFEGKQIPYSIRREIEYNGEDTPVTMYWPVEESLQSGTYRVKLFADGNLIGQASFTL